MSAAKRRVARRRWRPLERELRERTGTLIAGVDEVGRGPLAGPVVACAVIMPPDARAIRGVDDSKVLTAAERTKLAGRIRERAVSWALGAASVREIERLNIYHATTLAMRRALRRLAVRPDHVLLDGRPIRGLEVPHTAVVGGDGCCYSIACASILAKVTRDRVMVALARRHDGYRWDRNVGYATPAHIAGLAEHGLTPHHRRTFFRVRTIAGEAPVPLELVPGDIAEETAAGESASIDAERSSFVLLEADVAGRLAHEEGVRRPTAEHIDIADLLLDLRRPPSNVS